MFFLQNSFHSFFNHMIRQFLNKFEKENENFHKFNFFVF